MEEVMSSPREERVIEEFQRRRQTLLRNFALAMVLIGLGLGLRQLIDSYPNFLGIGVNTWRALSIAQLISGVVFAVTGFNQYKCPVCDKILRAHDKYYLGVAINPDKCPHCGARLS
jgi:predicted RNA-binding Zn-ribbon protein involved in translation (DUF1610 family)